MQTNWRNQVIRDLNHLRWEDRYCELPPDVEDRFEDIFTEAIEALCDLAGHTPHPDQCGIPAHDLCFWCGKSMPDQAPRLGVKVEGQPPSAEQ